MNECKVCEKMFKGNSKTCDQYVVLDYGSPHFDHQVTVIRVDSPYDWTPAGVDIPKDANEISAECSCGDSWTFADYNDGSILEMI